MTHAPDSNLRPPFDTEISDIARYVHQYQIESKSAYDTARLCFMDSMGCAALALSYLECRQLLGPVVPGAVLQGGARVPGTAFELDPIQAAFNIGTMIRWLDYNDTWLAQEWGHPSDNLGGILAVADYLSRKNKSPLRMKDVFTAMIKAYEIQGVLALENSFNRVGIDHVVLVKVATTAVVSPWLGLDQNQTCDAISQAFVDGQSLRTYRHAPNTGARKSWAAGDATARGVRLAYLTLQGEKGYPSALSAKRWGLYDVLFGGKAFQFQRPYGTYVMENILFKVAYPAEFHAQTAVECALQLHSTVKNRIPEIEKICIYTQEPAMRILNKVGPLYNSADRDHSLQYMVAIALLYGELTAAHYADSIASDPRIDTLREKMQVSEEVSFSHDYLDPEKCAIPNSIQIYFVDGGMTDKITVSYPIGHYRRRDEAIPLLENKCYQNIRSHFTAEKTDSLFALCQDMAALEKMPVQECMELFSTTSSGIC
jgi:2-methylcitrate dehydratase